MRLKDTYRTVFKAGSYSLGFCWRNCRWETVSRVTIAIVGTLLSYLAIQSSGLIFNAVVVSLKKLGDGEHSYTEIAKSGLTGPIVFLVSVILASVLLGRSSWFFRSRWNQNLFFANRRDLNDHRATLDVARVRSEEYDNLSKRISDLPRGWETRVAFADEVLTLFTTCISFVLFGASLLWYKPIYALVIVLGSLPMMIVVFDTTGMWWNLIQNLVPHKKKREVLERPYYGTNSFVQALMFNQMPTLKNLVRENVSYLLGAHSNVRMIITRKEVLAYLCSTVVLCGVLVYEIFSTVKYHSTVGALSITIAAARTFQGNLESIVSIIADQWNTAKGVILIEEDFFGLKPFVQTENPVVPDFGSSPPEIVFENVSFTYPNAKSPALHDVSFTIKSGSKIGIVGKNGNGKSTIQALLTRHYDPSEGKVVVGGVNLRNIEPRVWCETAVALTQDYTILERKVGQEIASSRLDREIDGERLLSSTRFANFDEVVDSDPLGFESQFGVEYGGRDFSGGEKQRLAIARVHYRGTPVLIVDEPDARLDPDSAKKVIESMFSLRGTTLVMITHHVSRVEQCDWIIVMGKGRIAEQGTHQELMAREGVYYKMRELDRERLGLN